MINSTLKTLLLSVISLGLQFDVVQAAPDYVSSWSASPQEVWSNDFIFPTNAPQTLANQSVHQLIRLSVGGERLRLNLSNLYGDSAVKVGHASVALVQSNTGDLLHLGAPKEVTFNQQKSAEILPGASLLSDPIDLQTHDFAELAITLYFPKQTPVTTFHWDARQTGWIVEGDQTQVNNINQNSLTTSTRLFLSSVQVERVTSTHTVAIMGDSITDGATASMNKNTRWPDFLAERLAIHDVAVINAGISGARLLRNGMGENGLARLHHDVLDQPGVSLLILMLGINDIAWPGTAFAPLEQQPNLSQLKAGYMQIVEQAHNAGVKVIGTTITPFANALPDTPLSNYYSREKDMLRQDLNAWIRSAHIFDGVIDFDAILRDENEPSKLARAFDSNDHLHPSDAGNAAMANAVDLHILMKLINSSLAN